MESAQNSKNNEKNNLYLHIIGKRWMTHEKVLISHEKRLIPHEESINVAIINSNSQKASKNNFFGYYDGWGCFEGAI